VTSVGAVVGEADIKNQLHTYGPVVAGFIVYEDFESYKDGVYRVTKNYLFIKLLLFYSESIE